MRERGTRFERSDVTFGPAGRVLATVLVLLPAVWFVLVAGIFAVMGTAIWLLFVLPIADNPGQPRW